MEKGKAGCKAYKITLVSLFAKKPGFDALSHQVPSRIHYSMTGLGALRAAPTNSHTELFDLLDLHFFFILFRKQIKLLSQFSSPIKSRRVSLTIKKKKKAVFTTFFFFWSRRRDLNPRPLGPEPSALPNCATPRSTAPMKALHRNSLDIINLFLKKNNRFYAVF